MATEQCLINEPIRVLKTCDYKDRDGTTLDQMFCDESSIAGDTCKFLLITVLEDIAYRRNSIHLGSF